MGQHYVWSQAATLKITQVCPKEGGTQNDNRNWTSYVGGTMFSIHLYIYHDIWYMSWSMIWPYMTPQTMFRKPPIFGAKNITNAMVSFGSLSICPQTSFNPWIPSGTNVQDGASPQRPADAASASHVRPAHPLKIAIGQGNCAVFWEYHLVMTNIAIAMV